MTHPSHHLFCCLFKAPALSATSQHHVAPLELLFRSLQHQHFHRAHARSLFHSSCSAARSIPSYRTLLHLTLGTNDFPRCPIHSLFIEESRSPRLRCPSLRSILEVRPNLPSDAVALFHFLLWWPAGGPNLVEETSHPSHFITSNSILPPVGDLSQLWHTTLALVGASTSRQFTNFE